MAVSAIILLQAMAAAISTSTPEPFSADLDLLHLRHRRCTVPSDGDISVCARIVDPMRYRLNPAITATLEEPILPRAEFGLFGDVRASVHADSVSRSDGWKDNRVVVTAKIPF